MDFKEAFWDELNKIAQDYQDYMEEAYGAPEPPHMPPVKQKVDTDKIIRVSKGVGRMGLTILDKLVRPSEVPYSVPTSLPKSLL